MLIISQCGKREGVYKSRPALPSALLTINKDTRSTLTEWHTMAIPYELLSLISTKKLSRQFLGLHDTTETYFRSNQPTKQIDFHVLQCDTVRPDVQLWDYDLYQLKENLRNIEAAHYIVVVQYLLQITTVEVPTLSTGKYEVGHHGIFLGQSQVSCLTSLGISPSESSQW